MWKKDVNDMMIASMPAKSAYVYVLAFTDGYHKSVKGHFSFFETKQSQVSVAIQAVNDSGEGPNIYSA